MLKTFAIHSINTHLDQNNITILKNNNFIIQKYNVFKK